MNGSSMLSDNLTHTQCKKKEVTFDVDGRSDVQHRPISMQSLPSTIDSHALQVRDVTGMCVAE